MASLGRLPLTRDDLPAELTPETLRELPIGTLRRFRDPHNGVLSPQEQASFDAALPRLAEGCSAVT